MRSFRIPGRKVGRIATTAALLVATIVPSFAPAIASAAQITARSVALDSSVINATGVNYLFTFTADNASAGGVAVKFCSNSPLITDTCTAPGNSFSVASGNVSGAGNTKYGTWTANEAYITKAVATGSNSFTITGVHNPSVTGTIYARVTTHDTDVHAAAGTDVIDNGSVAFAITNGVSVSGAVLESLTFCVSGAAIANVDCTGTTAPVLTLGSLDAGSGLTSLNSSSVSEGNVYTMLSTNASSGAVVSLKSSATCGGLAFNGDNSTCHIAASGTSGDIAAGNAKFGVKVVLPSNNVTDGVVAVDSNYSTSNFRFDGSAVTSTYGDAVFSVPGYASGKDTTLTFGASAAPNTPAGKYSTSISLIATGTF